MFKKLTLEFWYHALFFAIVAWVLLITNGCATTDQYGCTARQNRLATKHYYKAKAKCSGRVDLLYRADSPIHDSSYTNTEYIQGPVRVETNTVYQTDTMRVGDTLLIRLMRTITNDHYRADTLRRVQDRARTVTVTQPGASKPEWEWRAAAILFALLFLWRLFRR